MSERTVMDLSKVDVTLRVREADGGLMLCVTQHHDQYREMFIDDEIARDPARVREAVDEIVEGFDG